MMVAFDFCDVLEAGEIGLATGKHRV